MEVERGRLRRIFGKVAAVVGVIATVAFYALGFQIGAAYVQDYQNSKAPETSISMVEQQASPTANLPWAAAGAAMAVSYGAGFAAIAAGKKRDRYGYSGSSYSGSSSNDGFFWGYMFGSSGNSRGSSRSSSSSDSKGAAAAIVIVGAAAIAAGATVVNYKGVRANFFTGEEPLKKKDNALVYEPFTKASIPEPLPEVKTEPAPLIPIPETVATPEPVKDIVVDPTLVKRWKPFAI